MLSSGVIAANCCRFLTAEDAKQTQMQSFQRTEGLLGPILRCIVEQLSLKQDLTPVDSNAFAVLTEGQRRRLNEAATRDSTFRQWLYRVFHCQVAEAEAFFLPRFRQFNKSPELHNTIPQPLFDSLQSSEGPERMNTCFLVLEYLIRVSEADLALTFVEQNELMLPENRFGTAQEKIELEKKRQEQRVADTVSRGVIQGHYIPVMLEEAQKSLVPRDRRPDNTDALVQLKGFEYALKSFFFDPNEAKRTDCLDYARRSSEGSGWHSYKVVKRVAQILSHKRVWRTLHCQSGFSSKWHNFKLWLICPLTPLPKSFWNPRRWPLLTASGC